jgi:protoheme IX farnesyltransferase
MWFDADIDRIMARTATRPIPAGKVTAQEALTFGMVLSVLSVMTIGILVNWLSAGLLAFTIWFYVHVYTMGLKRRTSQNIVIGGLAGAMPPAIGWAAATGSLALEPLVLVLIIFLWTPPHFWALALYRSGDYAKAGVPMLPVASGDAETRRQILIYTGALVASTALPVLMGFASWTYAAAALIGGAEFIRQALAVYRSGTLEAKEASRVSMKLFAFSIFYLFGLFAVLLVETLIGLAPFIKVIG